MRYHFIHAEKTRYPLVLLCKTLGVSRQGYYSWLGRAEAPKRCWKELDQAILDIHRENRHLYGTRRMTVALAKRGFHVGRDTVRDRMNALEIEARYPRAFKRTTEADPSASFAPNLVKRNFGSSQANRLWVGDITYLRTPWGFIYLAVVIDLFSRMVVGWSIQSQMKAELVDDALKMALGRRDVSAGLIFHSDRGSQYTSELFRETCRNAGIIQSMSRKGDCWDNAVSESFFATLEKELCIGGRGWSPKRLKLEVFTYIETYYNKRRLHSSIGYESPASFERKAARSALSAEAA